MYVEHNLDQAARAIAGLPANVTRKIMREVAQIAERETLRKYRSTVRTWANPPQFQADTDFTSTSASTVVGTDSEVYGYVDRGTRPHAIAPKGPGYPLRFRSKYQAKTRPGVIGSRQGGASGHWIHAMAVWHPGTQARRFTEIIFREIGALMNKKTLELIGKELRKYQRVVVGRVRRVR
jgi:hypothetical protein